MKKKILGAVVSTLLIITVVFAMAETTNVTTYKEVQSPLIMPQISISMDKFLVFWDSAETDDSKWDCYDDNTSPPNRYWGQCNNRMYDGLYSFYCAERYRSGNQEIYIDNSGEVHRYVSNMDAFIMVNDENSFDLTPYDYGKFSYYYWVDASSDTDDYLYNYWNNALISVVYESNTLENWWYRSWKIPNIVTRVGFIFHSDQTIVDEGAYVDTIRVRGYYNVTMGGMYSIVLPERLYVDASMSTSEYEILEYIWDFGDGSYEQGVEATHIYDTPGLYNLTLTIIDVYNNINTAYMYVNVKKDTNPPSIQITKPEKALYINNQEIIPFFTTIIVGIIDIEVQASDNESGMNRVEFYVDDELKITKGEEPYKWLWDETIFGVYIIKAVAFDNAENQANDEIEIIIFNI